MKLNIGPAATTLILPHTGAPEKLPGWVSSRSSPSIAQDPPNGRSFSEYRVPPQDLLRSLGPIPSENSVTTIPFFFASRKWPSSWNKIMALNMISAIKIFNLTPSLQTIVNETNNCVYKIFTRRIITSFSKLNPQFLFSLTISIISISVNRTLKASFPACSCFQAVNGCFSGTVFITPVCLYSNHVHPGNHILHYKYVDCFLLSNPSPATHTLLSLS